jgi:hypothetical protein
VDALLKGIEVEAVQRRHDDLAVDDAADRTPLDQGRAQLGKAAIGAASARLKSGDVMRDTSGGAWPGGHGKQGVAQTPRLRPAGTELHDRDRAQ